MNLPPRMPASAIAAALILAAVLARPARGDEASTAANTAVAAAESAGARAQAANRAAQQAENQANTAMQKGADDQDRAAQRTQEFEDAQAATAKRDQEYEDARKREDEARAGGNEAEIAKAQKAREKAWQRYRDAVAAEEKAGRIAVGATDIAHRSVEASTAALGKMEKAQERAQEEKEKAEAAAAAAEAAARRIEHQPKEQGDLLKRIEKVRDDLRKLAFAPPPADRRLASLVAAGKVAMEIRGSGQPSGVVATLHLTNRTAEPVSGWLSPAVLDPEGDDLQPVGTLGDLVFTLPGGGTGSYPLRGTCLDRTLPPVGPDDRVAFAVHTRGDPGFEIEYQPVLDAIQEIAVFQPELLRTGAFGIPDEVPREVVLQAGLLWAGWLCLADLTGEEITDQEALDKLVELLGSVPNKEAIAKAFLGFATAAAKFGPRRPGRRIPISDDPAAGGDGSRVKHWGKPPKDGVSASPRQLSPAQLRAFAEALRQAAERKRKEAQAARAGGTAADPLRLLDQAEECERLAREAEEKAKKLEALEQNHGATAARDAEIRAWGEEVAALGALRAAEAAAEAARGKPDAEEKEAARKKAAEDYEQAAERHRAAEEKAREMEDFGA